jgi:hypothetical protein
MPEKEPMAEVRLELELGGMWGAQIQFFHAVQDWVKSVNVGAFSPGLGALDVDAADLIVARARQSLIQ